MRDVRESVAPAKCATFFFFWRNLKVIHFLQERTLSPMGQVFITCEFMLSLFCYLGLGFRVRVRVRDKYIY